MNMSDKYLPRGWFQAISAKAVFDMSDAGQEYAPVAQ
jgi:hypothetical protein